jgi:hypothetical protein
MAAIFAGCRDFTSPSSVPVDRIAASYAPNLAEEAPDVTTMIAPAVTVTDGSLPSSSALNVTFAHPIVAEVAFSSSVSGEKYSELYKTWSLKSFGVRGDVCTTSSSGRISFGSNAGIWNPCSPAIPDKVTEWVDTMRIRGTTSLGRNSHSTAMDWSASAATATIRPIPVEMKIRPLPYQGSTVEQLDEATVLLTGTSIELQPFNTPDTVRLMKTPLSAPLAAMIFTPDNGAPPVTCNGGWDTDPTFGQRQVYCRLINVTHSGTFTITAMANGKWQTKVMRIIKKRDFKVVPNPPDTLVGSTVRFIATMDGHEVPVEHWSWEGPGNGSVPLAMMSASSTSASVCPEGESFCDRMLDEVGTGSMTARLASGDSAFAPATARDTVCAPVVYNLGSGNTEVDSILNDPEVRKYLKLLWDSTGAHLIPVYLRTERGMTVYRDQSGKFIPFIHPVQQGDGLCTNSPYNHPNPPGQRVAVFHTHPINPNGSYTCSAIDTIPKINSDRWGGPSREDWTMSATVQPASYYVIDPVNIYRIKNYPNTPWDPTNPYSPWVPGYDGVLEPNQKVMFDPQYYQKVPRVIGSCTIA